MNIWWKTYNECDTYKNIWTNRNGQTAINGQADRQEHSMQAADTIPLTGVGSGFFVTEILGSDLVSGFTSGFGGAFGSGFGSVLRSGSATATGTALGSVDGWGLDLGASRTAGFRTSLDKTENY